MASAHKVGMEKAGEIWRDKENEVSWHMNLIFSGIKLVFMKQNEEGGDAMSPPFMKGLKYTTELWTNDNIFLSDILVYSS